MIPECKWLGWQDVEPIAAVATLDLLGEFKVSADG
jgi:hypothetical protein